MTETKPRVMLQPPKDFFRAELVRAKEDNADLRSRLSWADTENARLCRELVRAGRKSGWVLAGACLWGAAVGYWLCRLVNP